jgi:hypothetical protein
MDKLNYKPTDEFNVWYTANYQRGLRDFSSASKCAAAWNAALASSATTEGNWPKDFQQVIKNAEDAAYQLGHAAALAKQVPAQEQDAVRFRYLTKDIADRHARQQRNDLLHRMPVMSYSAACASIDAQLAQSADTAEG